MALHSLTATNLFCFFNHHKPPKKEKKKRNHHCPDEDARLRHLITVFVAGSKHASNWHLFPGCVDRHRRFVSMSHFTFSICPEAGLYIFLLTVCLHARGFILCVLAFHPHRKWSFPPPPRNSVLCLHVDKENQDFGLQCQTCSPSSSFPVSDCVTLYRPYWSPYGYDWPTFVYS